MKTRDHGVRKSQHSHSVKETIRRRRQEGVVPSSFHASLSNKNETTTPTVHVLEEKTPSLPFPVETTLTFDAIQHWAKVDPHRTALIYTDKQWKVDHGKLSDQHLVNNDSCSKDMVAPPPQQQDGEWKIITYMEFYDQVTRFRAALHSAGVPLPSSTTRKNEPYRILLLYVPPSRADVLALLIALQAAHCNLLFGTPDAFGGIRTFIETMMKLEPDAVLCNRMVYAVFRSICLTLKKTPKKKPVWFKSSLLTHVAPKLTPQQIKQYTPATTTTSTNNISIDTVTTTMFSSGTTGPPTPIEVTHRMLCFQAAGYCELLQKHLGPNVIRNHTTITGVLDDAGTSVSTSQRRGPWTSTHIFVNFVMLDLVLGGTAVMQPMGLSSPDKTVCSETLHKIWCQFHTDIASAPPALWKRLLQLQVSSQQKQQHRLKQREAANATDDSSSNSSHQSVECIGAVTNSSTNNNSSGISNDTTVLNGLKMAFVGGAETSATFARDMANAFFHPQNNISSSEPCGLYRLYGTTQVLPIAIASITDILHGGEQDTTQLCARGYGVCLGRKVDDMEVSVDSAVWEEHGALPQLSCGATDGHDSIKIGEICVVGKAVSPSMDVVGTCPQDGTAIREFRSGDIGYLEPKSQQLYFLGRMAQAVDCGHQLKLVPPVGIEMVCIETQVVRNCAFVGVPTNTKKGGISPTLVVQLLDHAPRDKKNTNGIHHNQQNTIELEFAIQSIRCALEKSIWAPVLNTNLRLVVYPKTWPVDCRHSSKTNRFFLRDWAATQTSHKFHNI